MATKYQQGLADGKFNALLEVWIEVTRKIVYECQEYGMESILLHVSNIALDRSRDAGGTEAEYKWLKSVVKRTRAIADKSPNRTP